MNGRTHNRSLSHTSKTPHEYYKQYKVKDGKKTDDDWISNFEEFLKGLGSKGTCISIQQSRHKKGRRNATALAFLVMIDIQDCVDQSPLFVWISYKRITQKERDRSWIG